MTSQGNTFYMPKQGKNAQGKERTVGFELEFSGLSLTQTVEITCNTLNGKITEQGPAETSIETEYGAFTVEVDWDFLKQTAKHVEQDSTPEAWLNTISQAAQILVPIEVVCPPIKISQLGCLNPLIDELRKHGAVGTEESLIAAYGVHINPEIPRIDASTIHRYLKAFGLLQYWLTDVQNIDIARRISPYIAPFSEQYLVHLLTSPEPDMDQLIDDYLHFNATRNRALDMLPLFSHINKEKVFKIVDDAKIKSRPTFHYRLPNCHIDDLNWQLAESWNIWCFVEKLANDPSAMNSLSHSLIDHKHGKAVEKKQWIQRIDQWIKDHELP
ncbi:amidoligase family protein [Thalassotalea aquiviva]|uniref:amidoligase family protein n=1 Tax=Thalassotalea aquiviva TaxID=3242415 RepID=UPI00352A8BCF